MYHTSFFAADIQMFVLVAIDCLVLGVSFSSVLITNLYFCVLYNGLFTLGANFPEWWILSSSRNFPNLEIYDIKIEKLTWAKLFTKFMLVHVHLDSGNRWDVCLNGHNSQSICSIAVHKEYNLVWPDHLQRKTFISCSQYKSPCSHSIYFGVTSLLDYWNPAN